MLKTKNFLSFMAVFCLIILAGCSSTSKMKPGETVKKKNRAAQYTSFGSRYYDEAQYSKALDFFFLALKENILIDNDRGIIQSYNDIGKTYLAAGKIDSAEKYYKKACENASFYDDPSLRIRCKNNRGEILLARKEYSSALALFIEAYGEIDNPENTEDAAVLMYNRGFTQEKLNNYKEAEKDLLLALAINRKNKNRKGMAMDTYTLASIYSKREQYPEALKYINEALALDKRTENSPGIAQDLYAKGIIEKKSGALETAYHTFKRDVLIFEALALSSSVQHCLTQLEILAKKLSRHDDLVIWQTAKKKLEEKNESAAQK